MIIIIRPFGRLGIKKNTWKDIFEVNEILPSLNSICSYKNHQFPN